MRLTEKQRKIIREAGIRHFGTIPHLFGSRLNPAVRGGDIDLFVGDGQRVGFVSGVNGAFEVAGGDVVFGEDVVTGDEEA